MTRWECLARIKKNPPYPIVAIIAGAGCGKSTLLRQIYDHWTVDGADRIWIALDEKDQNPEELWTLLLNGFEAIDSEIILAASEYFDMQGLSNIAQSAALLKKGIEAHKRPVALFIDDLQFASENDSMRLLQELLRGQPENLNISFASRIAPNLPIETLKVENKLLEFAWQDLAFSETETAKFFEVDSQSAPSRATIRHLHQYTEGWAAGLQLAMMKARLDENFSDETPASGYADDVAQYFRAEILSAFQPEVRNFLVRTSVLDRFNDGLAAEVAGVDIKTARRILDFLHDRSFFLTALDGDGKWKRYHHLVREFLAQASFEEQTTSIASAECAASVWFEQRALIPEAIEYAIRGKLFDRAGELVEAYAIDLFNRGAAAELAAWIQRIPEKIIVERPQLPLHLCLMYAHTRQPIEGLRLQYEKSKQMIATLNAVGHFASADEHAMLVAELEAAHTLIRFREGDMSGVIESGLKIIASKQKMRTAFEASLHNVIGYAYYVLGENAEARRFFGISRELHLSAGCVFGVVFATAFEGMVDFSEGATITAQKRFSSAFEYAASELGETSLPASVAKLYSYVIRYEINDHIEVDKEFDLVLRECRLCCEPEIYATVLVIRHHLLRQRGLPAEADAALDDAVAYARKNGNDLIYLQVCYTALTYKLSIGSMPSAMEIFANSQALWEDVPKHSETGWNRKSLWRDLFCGEILLATAQPRKAVEIFKDLAERTLKQNRMRRHVQALTKYAEALASVGENDQVIEQMKKALRLAKSARFARTIMDCGPRVLDLLELCRPELEELEEKVFADSLLGAKANDDQNKKAMMQKNTFVLDELTTREIEILRILTTGAKNKEICRKLSLSENTIKWYMSRIMEKLGADNRTDAAIIAKSMFSAL